MTSRGSARSPLGSWFLGPHAENGEVLEKLAQRVVEDYAGWRADFHPADPRAITWDDKHSAAYAQGISSLESNLERLLAELKHGAPSFSQRYKGHMIGDQTLAGQLGYFAGMLHNPNNISSEVAQSTTRLEHEVARDLARMLGYCLDGAWGHLTSGGTIANFEALWMAHATMDFPVAAACAATELGVTLNIELPDRSHAPLANLGLFDLLNIRTSAALDLMQALRESAAGPGLRDALEKHSIATAGYQVHAETVSRHFGHRPQPAVVLVPATAHYSWEKIVRALGIGARQLVFVPVDERCRMDPDGLWRTVKKLADARTPIIACVSVCGSTEESAMDRLDLLCDVRARAERELGVTFHMHSDACYGGYAAAVTWDSSGKRKSAEQIRATAGIDWPSDEWQKSMVALSRVDSVSIDPHKLGFVPYPAGALIVRDRRARDLVATDPPYLLPTTLSRSREDLIAGRFSFEGTRPGAAAAGVWLSHRVLPLDERGYGHLIEQTVVGARRLYAALKEVDISPNTIVTLPEPDLNIVCFFLYDPRMKSLAEINELNELVYREMSQRNSGDEPPYIVSRTRLRAPMYHGAAVPLLETLSEELAEQWQAGEAGGLVVLRSTVMDPFLARKELADVHVTGFVEAVASAAKRVARKGSVFQER